MITVMMFMGVMLMFLASHTQMSRLELQATGGSARSTLGFFAAEAGLNLRASAIRQIFLGYTVPSGVSPTPNQPCTGNNLGSGDLRCISYTLNDRTVRTYIRQEPGNPYNIKIPLSERYGGLSAEESRFTAISEAVNRNNLVEARLELTFRSRVVPMFQFAAFYNKDLEINPGPQMILNGPVHTNGDLYLNANNRLDIRGKITTTKTIFRGRKNENLCNSKNINLFNPLTGIALVPNCSTRITVTPKMLTSYNGEVEMNVPVLVVPAPESLQPSSTQMYWKNADIRIVLQLTSTGNVSTTYHSSGIEVRNVDGSTDAIRTSALHGCTSATSMLGGGKAVASSNSLFNRRENSLIRMLEVDMQTLLNCIHSTSLASTPLLLNGSSVNDATHGGLVLYFTVMGPRSNLANSYYGVRVRNGETLASSLAGAPPVKGVTVVTDQAAYVRGEYNSPPAGDHLRIPAAFLSDTFQVLSNAWPTNDYASSVALTNRNASHTTVNSAVLSGTDTTGNIEGTGGQNLNLYNGGLENYPRFLEDWSGGITFTYRGSFVSLSKPSKSSGLWGASGVYEPPNRVWDYDATFNSAEKLPPLAPRFVYLRQELFVRDFGEP